MSKRRILQLTGEDVPDFLQGLITNDIGGLKDGLVYAALLTPQGKYISDFFVVPQTDGVLLDVTDDQADMLVQRLSMYKLRADVTISQTGLHLHRGTGDIPSDGFADPRHASLGWRAYRDHAQADDTTDWTAIRVAAMIPESGVELTPDTFILEVGFERLNGVDFRKGCYVGQEVTARMKHKTELRKGLALVSVSGAAEPGTEITAGGRAAGKLLSRSGDTALAYLRFDRAGGEMQAGEARLTRIAT
ncbi:folate-binding protein [uncultured Roseobacter sp.]|uniref:CAF17-like 4Fe-4S cluster assembly/insertion protein YgfZ n=1 Tax=uncultured Roseobacter sp. TaxID=114847 RepID=UPI002621D165|nr:folate-binding protein [uncultured Roseobacter sp.]